MKIEITYYRKHDIAGRMYPRGPALAKLPREARTAAGNGRFFDFDINLAHPTLLLEASLRKCGKTSVLTTFPIFRKYVANYKTWRLCVSTYAGVSIKEAKKSLGKLCYGGMPDYNLPFMWALWGEMQAAARILLADTEFHYLDDYFADRKHPEKTRLFYAISKLEDAALMRAAGDFLDGFGGSHLNCFIYDGFIGITPPDVEDAAIVELAASMSEDNVVVWSVDRLG